MNLYSLAIQQLTRQHMATIEALVRQQPEFDRVEDLADRLRQAGARRGALCADGKALHRCARRH